MSTQLYADFDFRFEFKISQGGNSGVMYRVANSEKHPYETGPEYQILDIRDGQDNTTTTGSLYGLYARTENASKPTGQWNTGRVLLRGNHIEHWLNGKKVVECELNSDDWNQRVADSKFSAWKKFGKVRSGHIVLQDYGDEIWFRNLRIRSLGE